MKFLLQFFAVLTLFVCSSNATASAAYDKDYIGDEIKYRAAYEDTFVHLARDYKLGYVEMLSANPGVDPWIPGEGTRLILPTKHLLPDAPRDGVVINLPEMRLYAFVNGDEAPATFPLGVGREGLATPTGTTKVVRKKEGPIWRPTKRMLEENPELKTVYLPGPDNPMGTHALYLGWPQYAIHGTNRPFGIGRRVSSGCIRMYPEDIKTVFDMVPVDTPVTVVNQAIKVGWIGNKLYIEAHPNIEQVVEMEENGFIKSPKLNDSDMSRIMKFAGKYKDNIKWDVVRKAVKERKGYPVLIAYRPSSESSDADDEDVKPDAEEVKETLEEINEALEGTTSLERADNIFYDNLNR